MTEVQGNIEYEIDTNTGYMTSVSYLQPDRVAITAYLDHYVNQSTIVVTDPFDSRSKDVMFVPQVEKICNDVFDAIMSIESKYGRIVGIADLSNVLFQAFTPYWREKLLKSGKDIIGIKFWHKVLEIVSNWEAKNKPTLVHKGTIYYFMAQNYLLTGDRDLAYVYLYNAIEMDKQLHSLGMQQYLNEPAYLTATIKDDKNNHMYPLISKVRNLLSSYIINYNKDFGGVFSLNEFDKKFLGDKNLEDTVYFFVYNFLYVFALRQGTQYNVLQNEFSKLRSLDLFFNLCLIIDETLKEAYIQRNGKLKDPHYISTSIAWLVESKGWIRPKGTNVFWDDKHLNIKGNLPDAIIPKLLSMSGQFEGNPVPKQVFTLSIAYALRNFGGHNIQQQKIFTTRYDEILRQLFNALFLSTEQLQ